jgi:hypothetical protein
MNTRRCGVPILCLLMLTVLIQGRGGAEEMPPTRPLQPTMQAIFQALTQVFPWSLDAQQFAAPGHRQRIHDALRLLAENTSALDAHGKDVPQSFGFLRRTLARTAHDVAQRYDQGQYQPARFALQQLTEQCFACHSRFTNPQPFDLGKRFLTAMPLEQLALRDRVRLAVATRQFDTALETCEALFRSASVTSADIDGLGVFEDYLKIVLRVQGDFPRAITTLEQFLGRADVLPGLRARVLSWVEALKELQPQGTSGAALARARALIAAGQRRNRFPADQLGLVHFVVASSLLHRSVDAQAPTTPALVEAYYLLGIAESSISRTSWVAETPFFLEMAIRLDPQSPMAVKAYDLLNAYMMTAYTGSAGTHLPHEVQESLEQLRRLRGGP